MGTLPDCRTEVSRCRPPLCSPPARTSCTPPHAGGLALQRRATATGWSRAAEMFHRFVVAMQSQLSDTDPLLDFSDPCASPSLPRDVRLGNHGRPTLGVPPWSPVQNACASSLQRRHWLPACDIFQSTASLHFQTSLTRLLWSLPMLGMDQWPGLTWFACVGWQ